VAAGAEIGLKPVQDFTLAFLTQPIRQPGASFDVRTDLLPEADVLACVNVLSPTTLPKLKARAVVIGFLKPLTTSRSRADYHS